MACWTSFAIQWRQKWKCVPLSRQTTLWPFLPGEEHCWCVSPTSLAPCLLHCEFPYALARCIAEKGYDNEMKCLTSSRKPVIFQIKRLKEWWSLESSRSSFWLQPAQMLPYHTFTRVCFLFKATFICVIFVWGWLVVFTQESLCKAGSCWEVLLHG